MDEHVTIEARVSDLPSDEPAVRRAAAELRTEVSREPDLRPAVSDVPTESSGKGLETLLAVALGSPTVIAAAVRVFHLWLSRDKRRSLTLQKDIIDQDGTRRTTMVITVEGRNLSEEIVRHAVTKIAEGS